MKVTAATRSRARHYAMQALYQWQMTKKTPELIEAEFHSDNDMSKVDVEYFSAAFQGAANDAEKLDEQFAPYLKDKKLQELDPVTLAVLRLAAFEFGERIDVPYKVVINEAVNLAKKFGAEESHKFINGVLDKLAKDLRQLEVQQQIQQQ